MVDTNLKRTPLEGEHVALGAKMLAFGGWWMPLEYAGTLREHRAVRETVGMFDLTHLGKIEVDGPGALDLLQRALTNDVSTVEVGAAQYNLILTHDGGIVDDLIAYREDDERYLVVPNAANTDAVLGMLEGSTNGEATVTHLPDLCTIAVQGPRAVQVVSSVIPEAADLAYMHFGPASREGVPLVARSGYTGEVGFEVFAESAAAPAVWRALADVAGPLGLEPCGLGARDTLRLEMGYPLHGNDISMDRTPLEAMLSWAVAFDKGDFTGRESLLRMKEEGIPARLCGLRMTDRLIPRAHYAVFSGDRKVGETTSGTFSPTLRVGIALAYLDPAVEVGDTVEVDVRGRRGRAEVVKPPFVDRSPR